MPNQQPSSSSKADDTGKLRKLIKTAVIVGRFSSRPSKELRFFSPRTEATSSAAKDVVKQENLTYESIRSAFAENRDSKDGFFIERIGELTEGNLFFDVYSPVPPPGGSPGTTDPTQLAGVVLERIVSHLDTLASQAASFPATFSANQTRGKDASAESLYNSFQDFLGGTKDGNRASAAAFRQIQDAMAAGSLVCSLLKLSIFEESLRISGRIWEELFPKYKDYLRNDSTQMLPLKWLFALIHHEPQKLQGGFQPKGITIDQCRGQLESYLFKHSASPDFFKVSGMTESELKGIRQIFLDAIKEKQGLGPTDTVRDDLSDEVDAYIKRRFGIVRISPLLIAKLFRDAVYDLHYQISRGAEIGKQRAESLADAENLKKTPLPKTKEDATPEVSAILKDRSEREDVSARNRLANELGVSFYGCKASESYRFLVAARDTGENDAIVGALLKQHDAVKHFLTSAVDGVELLSASFPSIAQATAVLPASASEDERFALTLRQADPATTSQTGNPASSTITSESKPQGIRKGEPANQIVVDEDSIESTTANLVNGLTTPTLELANNIADGVVNAEKEHGAKHALRRLFYAVLLKQNGIDFAKDDQAPLGIVAYVLEHDSIAEMLKHVSLSSFIKCGDLEEFSGEYSAALTAVSAAVDPAIQRLSYHYGLLTLCRSVGTLAGSRIGIFDGSASEWLAEYGRREEFDPQTLGESNANGVLNELPLCVYLTDLAFDSFDDKTAFAKDFPLATVVTSPTSSPRPLPPHLFDAGPDWWKKGHPSFCSWSDPLPPHVHRVGPGLRYRGKRNDGTATIPLVPAAFVLIAAMLDGKTLGYGRPEVATFPSIKAPDWVRFAFTQSKPDDAGIDPVVLAVKRLLPDASGERPFWVDLAVWCGILGRYKTLGNAWPFALDLARWRSGGLAKLISFGKTGITVTDTAMKPIESLNASFAELQSWYCVK